jgi:hypothetical protein
MRSTETFSFESVISHGVERTQWWVARPISWPLGESHEASGDDARRAANESQQASEGYQAIGPLWELESSLKACTTSVEGGGYS